ncbi:MAG: NADH-quinone oxidoreductase subunit N [Candidatus Sericytochromatia bacterium]|nr:NADH-quinone oxidoreductase subunit N [Candidatus Tanganyikabacteria bacterium]
MDFVPLLPLLAPIVGGLLILLLIPPARAKVGKANKLVAAFGAGALAVTLLAAVRHWVENPSGFHESYFGGAFLVDNFSLFFTGLAAACGLFTVIASQPYAAEEGMDHPELYGLLLFAVSGMALLAGGNDLIVLFLGVEIMSLAVYALVGLRRGDKKANEATLKYVLLGAFSSAILLYGIALVYGATGSTRLLEITAYQGSVPGAAQSLYFIGLFMLVGGLAFKVAAVPFHMWAPDVYEGAAAPITGFMATAVKAASFALALRVLLVGFSGEHANLVDVLWWLAVLSMFGGNILALAQRNLKRMLAYSSIAHTGYLLVGLVAASRADPTAATAMLVYLAAYAVTNLGAFACLTYLAGREDRGLFINDWQGVARTHPWIALALGICLLSLIGFPPTAGFFGKYLLFTAAIKAAETPLAVIAILNSILSVWYYLRVVVVMSMPTETGVAAQDRAGRWGAGLGAVFAAIAVLWAGFGTFTLAGLLPGAQSLLGWARLSIDTLF